MSEQQTPFDEAATPLMRPRRALSLVWIVPLTALLIGGWLAVKAISERGPQITITFADAEGLEAGKTKIKYRDVTIGQVERISLSADFSHVVVSAALAREARPYLTEQTAFWIVRPRMRGGSVSGLETVLSGAYIAVDPGRDGKPARDFIGLEVPPVVTMGQVGRHFTLHADHLGSLDIGSPVYYRQIQVGQVVGYDFGDNGKQVEIKLFIEAPYHRQVTENSRFWNASGISLSLNAQGVKMETESLVALISGGIAFEVPAGSPPGAEAAGNAVFRLYPDRAAIQEKSYAIRSYWMLLFEQSVRGLHVGAPVELFGIKVGEVVSLDLEYDAQSKDFQVPVIVAIEPERIRLVNTDGAAWATDGNFDSQLEWLVEQRGLRAQLKNGNLLTGQLMVHLDLLGHATPEKLRRCNDYPVVPTIPAPFDLLQESVTRITAGLEQVPFGEIGGDLRLLLREARSTLHGIDALSATLSDDAAPQLNATLLALQTALGELSQRVAPHLCDTLDELRDGYGPQAPLPNKANIALEELTRTLRAVRDLADTLERQPQSLLYGKEKREDGNK